MPYAKRRCTGSPTCPEILTSNQRYCPTHLAEYEKQRGTSTDRGYDAEHQRLKALWQWRIDQGYRVFCKRGCGKRITGTDWHLGHTDDRTEWTGPECVPCSTADGGRKGLRARR